MHDIIKFRAIKKGHKMNKINYKIIKDSFYKCYESIMNLLRVTSITNNNNLYCILILRKPINNTLCKVKITINSYSNTNENYSLKEIIISNDEAQILINEIRNDFKNKHYISYATVNENNIQRLQNTNYSLNINLLNENEINEALDFNKEINNNMERHKMLIKK